MTDPQLLQATCTRGIAGSQFVGGVQNYPFSIGQPYAWLPSKSYFLIKATLKNLAGTAPLTPAQLTTFADNFPGALWDNIYIQGGSCNISKLTTYVAQADALDKRIHNSYAKIKSIGGVSVNEASFQKRLLAFTSHGAANGVTPAVANIASMTGMGAYDDRDVFRPYDSAAAVNFAGATVGIATTGVVTGVNTNFLAGMPLGSASTGGSVLQGDILVVNGVPYSVIYSTAAGGDTALTATTFRVVPSPQVAVAPTTDWFIVRTDVIRTPQTANQIEVMWQPPLGLLKSTEWMGAGNWQLVMSPNSAYQNCVIETKDPNWASVSPWSLSIDDVFFYYQVQKMSIPEGPRNLFLQEYGVDSKQASSNLSFEVSSSTNALTVFIQDTTSGSSPLAPPSMFKALDNSDLKLATIQIQYAGITKTATPWLSDYKAATVGASPANNYINQLQQRYYDSFNECGMDPNALGCESFSDWLKRGPFYHFDWERDMSNRSTTVQINLSFVGGAVPATCKVFLVSHKRVTCQMITDAGAIVSATTADA